MRRRPGRPRLEEEPWQGWKSKAAKALYLRQHCREPWSQFELQPHAAFDAIKRGSAELIDQPKKRNTSDHGAPSRRPTPKNQSFEKPGSDV